MVRYKDADRCKLLMDFLPSATTKGREEKSESSSTRLATFLAASAPDCMAIEQSASSSANTSFAPSPVMATVCPAP